MPILYEQFGPSVVRLSLNRPERNNAFSEKMLRLLIERLEALRVDPDCRVLLVSGEGDHFCSGLDLHEATQDESTAYRLTSQVVEVLLRLRQLPQIVIAAVHGAARGGGAGLSLAADLAIASDDANFAFPEIRRGLEPVLLFPLLRRKFDDPILRQLLLTGRPIGAVRAHQLGWVAEYGPREALLPTARLLADEILLSAPEAVRGAKRMLLANENSRFSPTLADEMRESLAAHARSWSTPSAREGIAAFLEKRAPQWNGKRE